MDHTIQKAVRCVIDETDRAYRDFSDFNSANSDYAEFAGMALAQFKTALRDPNLTNEKLQRLLRSGMRAHYRPPSEIAENWSNFMASYVTRAANERAVETV